jgi:hypothetical protein
MRGFSTLELLIAMTVLVLAIGAALSLIPNAGFLGADAAVEHDALGIAHDAIAQEAAFARTDVKLVTASSSEETIDAVTYHTAISVEQVGLRSKRVTVTVSWNGLYGRSNGVSQILLVPDYWSMDTTCGVRTDAWNIPITHSIRFGTIAGLQDSVSPYPLTDISVDGGVLYATVNETVSPLPSEGPNDAGAALDDPAVGSIAWSNPSSARVSDGVSATAPLTTGTASHYLSASHFGFHIPRGATILGIEVDVERKSSSNTNTIRDKEIRIIRADGSLGDTNKARATNWPTSLAYATYGSSGDLWNEDGWSADAINNPQFGVAVSAAANLGTNPRTASVDHVRITVTYTEQFYVVSVSDAPTLLAGLGENTVTTGMDALAVASSTSLGRHAYVALNSGTTQFEAIDLSDTPRVVGTYHVAGNAVANTIAYRDGYAYLGLASNASGPEFVVIDVHDPTSPALVGSYEVGAGVNAIRLAGARAYLATDDSAREVEVLEVSDLVHPIRIASYDAPGSVGSGQGRALDVIGDTLYLGRYYSLTVAPEFITIDTSLPEPALLGAHDVGPSSASPLGVYDLDVRDGVALLTTSSHAGGNVTLLDVHDVAHPSFLTSLALPDAGGGVALACERNRVYVASVPQSGTYTGKGSLTFIDPL